jgi:predicted DNA-binding transcriptional regulator AlpA
MTEKVLTLAQLAQHTGLHRSTLVRMEQRLVIPKARWAGPPVNGRVYNDAEVKAVDKAIAEYLRGKADNAEGRELATDVEIHGR